MSRRRFEARVDGVLVPPMYAGGMPSRRWINGRDAERPAAMYADASKSRRWFDARGAEGLVALMHADVPRDAESLAALYANVARDAESLAA